MIAQLAAFDHQFCLTGAATIGFQGRLWAIFAGFLRWIQLPQPVRPADERNALERAVAVDVKIGIARLAVFVRQLIDIADIVGVGLAEGLLHGGEGRVRPEDGAQLRLGDGALDLRPDVRVVVDAAGLIIRAGAGVDEQAVPRRRSEALADVEIIGIQGDARGPDDIGFLLVAVDPRR